MNPHRVLTEEEFENELTAAGFTKTTRSTETGAYWRSKTAKHLLLPNAYEGMFPEFIIKDVRARMSVLSRDPIA